MSIFAPIDPKVDPYVYLGLIKNPNGVVTRNPEFIAPAATAANPDPSSPLPILSKDVSINREKNTFVRVYLPRSAVEKPTMTKLPLLFYFHGGGFVLGINPASTVNHNFCYNLVDQIPSVLVSVSYRLAPEHRLPAAYDDCMEALHVIRTTDDEWLTKYADFSICFLSGTSAGGNIAYYLGLTSAACIDQLMPLKIKGFILHQPFFGGVERTPSEIRLVHDKIIPLNVTDIFWDLALPVGANRDHEFCNPIKHLQVEAVDKMKNEGWRFLVTGYDGDLLIDSQVEMAKMLRERGVDVVEVFKDGECHAIELWEEDKASILYSVIKNFMLDS